MARSTAATVEALLAELPADRRAVVAAVREVILKYLPAGYVERVNWGAIAYEIPLDRYPNTYNGQPLCYAGLAAQKHHYAIYLMCLYGSVERGGRLAAEFKVAGKRLDMGKSCLRFKSLDDLPLDVVGRMIGGTTPEQYIAGYEAAKGKTKSPAAKGRAGAVKAKGRRPAKGERHV
jgi:hypothetical protein